MRFGWGIVIVAGCYAPVPVSGAPCAANGDCPAPLVCDQARAIPTCERSLSDAGPDDVGPDVAPDGGIDAAVDAPPAACLDDNFNDGTATDWTIVDTAWAVRPNAGPDSSFAFAAINTTGDQMITHPALLGIKTARLSLDVRLDNPASSDFSIFVMKPGWTDPNGSTAQRYFASIYVNGGDSGPDRIVRSVPPAAFVELTTRPTSVVASTWRHVDLEYRANGSIRLDLDQAMYMESPPDTALTPPFDLVIRFWALGAIDNVHLDCTR